MVTLITSDDINKITSNDDGQALIDAYFSATTNAINQALCNPIVPKTDGSVPGVVGSDGVTVELGYWFSAVTGVDNTKGDKLDYTFTATVGDLTADGKTTTMYAHTLTLKAKLPVGTLVTVSGTYGFDPLPDSLKQLLAAALVAYDEAMSGDDKVTHKAIEDVTVEKTATTGKAPISSALDSYQATADKWSLCADKFLLGKLSFPAKLPNPPYYFNGADIGWRSANYAYGNAM